MHAFQPCSACFFNHRYIVIKTNVCSSNQTKIIYKKNWMYYQLSVYIITELSLFNNKTNLLFNKSGNACGPP